MEIYGPEGSGKTPTQDVAEWDTGLGTGAAIVVYDGSPFHPDGNVLFDYVADERVNVFGTSAKYIDAVKKSGLEPSKTHRLKSLKAILSTGSPLLPESFDFVYEHIKRDICLSSITGSSRLGHASGSSARRPMASPPWGRPGLAPRFQAMRSKWAQGMPSPTKAARNRAAVMAPP